MVYDTHFSDGIEDDGGEERCRHCLCGLFTDLDVPSICLTVGKLSHWLIVYQAVEIQDKLVGVRGNDGGVLLHHRVPPADSPVAFRSVYLNCQISESFTIF